MYVPLRRAWVGSYHLYTTDGGWHALYDKQTLPCNMGSCPNTQAETHPHPVERVCIRVCAGNIGRGCVSACGVEW